MASFASQTGYAVDFGALFAAVVITVVPGLVVYIIFQRQMLYDGGRVRIAVSGHRGLPDDTVRLVDRVIRDVLDGHTDGLVGLSCLADGADQIFARAVIEAGGQLDVIVPATEYRDGLPEPARSTYDELLAEATDVHRLDHTRSDETAHMDASRTMLDTADALIAVWDGKPARGYGGTADVVALARKQGLPVTVIWPEGSRRD